MSNELGTAFALSRMKYRSLQELNPWPDVTRIPDVAVKAKFRTQERGTQLGDLS